MNPLVSRAAALALALGLPALLVFGAVLPLQERLQTLDEEVVGLEAQIARFQEQLTRAEPRTEIEILDNALLDGASEASAAAQLQDLADRTVSAAGSEVESIRVEQTRPFQDGTDAVEVPITVELTADMPALQRLLHRVESGTPYLFVDRLAARAVRRGSDPEAAVEVSLSLQISGVYQPTREP